MEEKIKALMENAEFAAKMEQAKSAAELVALFKAEGVEVTEDAVKQAQEEIENEELDEATLENVSGGSVGGSVKYHLLYIGYRLAGYSAKDARKKASQDTYDDCGEKHGWGIK